MDFRQLETFVEVAKLKSFSRAAEKLYLTQPTVTSHIQNLEKELGTLLINRLSKKITLTDAGEILYKYAVNIINMREMAEFDLGVHKGKIEGHLEISSSSIPKQYVLPHLLKEFSKKYPDVTFTVSHNDSKTVTDNILQGNTDFGIVGAKYNSKHLEYINLIEDSLVVITPNNNNYPWEPYETLDKDFLLNQKIILREKGSGTRHLIEKVLHENNLALNSLNIVAYVEDTETIKRFVEKGIGISIVSERAVKKEIEEGTIRPYHIRGFIFTRNFYFVFHNNRHLSPLTKAFKEFMIEFIKNKSSSI
ncbi:LysR family transcriptional regulator [Caldisalinibacter kiritimatiensis]|uniref:LysR family transcriptional regulator n=1 Tax=Caldisalinibacter kiritimatiensis TaxID=1304284 RepID=R1ART1_9FIRM|nr:LysR family transcriptional regulator [Caldisalinibacter kiritimatiensis]